jgi:hypothetical protein
MADVGTLLVDSLYPQLMVDDQSAIRRDRGFTWWGYRLAQHIEVQPPTPSRGLDVCVVRIWTEVVRDVDPASNPAWVLGQVNYQVTLNALVWDPATATISECCTATVHRDNAGWMSKILATAAVLQNTAAHSRAHSLAEACGGQPAESHHPTSGVRGQMDDMLNVPAEVIMPMGKEPSKFIGEPCSSLGAFFAEFAGDRHWFGTADATGATLEVPFTGATPAGFLPANWPDVRPQTTLTQVFPEAPHPEFGNGALVITRLPVSPGAEQAIVLANELNRADFAADHTAPPLLGAWCPDVLSEDGNELAFCSFLPNLLALPDILKNWMLHQSTRALFARDFLNAQICAKFATRRGIHD